MFTPRVEKGTLLVDVHLPRKTDTLYEFRVDYHGRPFRWETVKQRAQAVADGYGSPFRTTERFGFRARNYRIQHAEVWDSIFPLHILIRPRGGLYRKSFARGVIRFRYPILEAVRQFYVRRAADFGLTVEVQADTFDRTYEIPGRGCVVSFGNGKESRLLVGLLRELGIEPRLCTGGASDRAADLDVELSDLFQDTNTERALPGLMAGAAHYYYGGTLAEVHYNRPWHAAYDRASPQGQAEFNALLRSLGVDLRMHCPLAPVPTHLIQKILAVRYPALYAHQRSVSARAESEKHFDVALLQLYHGLDISSHCNEALFRRLALEFVEIAVANPDDFGHNNTRLIHRLELRALLWRLRNHPFLSDVRSRLKPEWDGRWVDHIHRYTHPDVEPEMLAIFHEYASDYDPQPGEFVVATPPQV